jgi:hypothetical protein
MGLVRGLNLRPRNPLLPRLGLLAPWLALLGWLLPWLALLGWLLLLPWLELLPWVVLLPWLALLPWVAFPVPPLPVDCVVHKRADMPLQTPGWFL